MLILRAPVMRCMSHHHIDLETGGSQGHVQDPRLRQDDLDVLAVHADLAVGPFLGQPQLATEHRMSFHATPCDDDVVLALPDALFRPRLLDPHHVEHSLLTLLHQHRCAANNIEALLLVPPKGHDVRRGHPAT